MLFHIYQMSGGDMSTSFNRDIVKFIRGMKRTVAKTKIESGESFDEGKKLMTYNVYNKLCEILFSCGGEDYLFEKLSLVLEWNLLLISDNFFSIHMRWSYNCLLF